jgi:CheY-like chemotaxis protein
VRAAALPELPVIGLTADVTDAQREICRAAGMTDLAIKPLTIEQMAALMFRHLPAAGLAAPAPDPAPAAALRQVAFEEQIYLAMFTPEEADGAAWLRDYLATARATIAEIAALFEVAPGADLPREAIGKTAHRLAGASFSVGAMLLGAAARGLELAAAAETPAQLAARRDRLAGELAVAERAITAFLAGAPVA